MQSPSCFFPRPFPFLHPPPHPSACRARTPVPVTYGLRSFLRLLMVAWKEVLPSWMLLARHASRPGSARHADVARCGAMATPLLALPVGAWTCPAATASRTRRSTPPASSACAAPASRVDRAGRGAMVHTRSASHAIGREGGAPTAAKTPDSHPLPATLPPLRVPPPSPPP